MYIKRPCRTRLNSVWLLALLIWLPALPGEPLVSAHAATEAGPAPVVLDLAVEAGAITLELDHPAPVALRHLSAPPRIVIDLPEAGFMMKPEDVALPDGVAGIRFGRSAQGRSRIIVTLDTPAWAVTADGAGSAPAAARHVITLTPVGEEELAALVEADLAALAPLRQGADAMAPGPPPADKPFTVVIDPGHGGIDGGATGPQGTIEKDLTLAFSLKLKAALSGMAGLRVVLTRETDVFLSLLDRVQAARAVHADLLLSVHADSIDDSTLRGATVYTLSDSASDAISRRLAEQENLADTIAGLPAADPDPVVNDILADLLKRETAGFSRVIAGQLIMRLEAEGIRLINNPKRSAGFRVLTAPDVPSILLELGYLSNAEDEKLMREEKWRRSVAGVVAAAVKAHSETHRAALPLP
jgi:N-acetylmuramoyl-L-alanine amidase